MRPAREPAAARWDFAALTFTPGEDLVCVGADLTPGTLLGAYREGLFPMGVGDDGRPPIGWWSPDPRGVLRPDELRVSRSLRQSARRAPWSLRIDTAFEAVLAGCADPSREGRWITPQIIGAYRRLYDAGWVHTVEVWEGAELVGGLYGVSIGGLFCGESMFRRRTDASKAALWGLCQIMTRTPDSLIDMQWLTPHLASLGGIELGRVDYRRLIGPVCRASSPFSSLDEGSIDAPWGR